jgi:hypothetical protein
MFMKGVPTTPRSSAAQEKHMEKSQFVDVVTPGWWLLQPSLDPPLDEARRKVGACWGWTDADGWYTKPDSLETVFQFLTDNQRRLLDELDQPQDAYQREKWCNDLIEARRPPEAEAPAAPPPPAARTAGGSAPPLAPPPPRKASAFGPRTAGQAEAEPPGPGSPAAAEQSAGTATAQPRKPSPFGKKVAATEEPAAPSAPAGGSESPPPPTVEEMRETIAALAENPAVPISTQELQAAERDPDFDAKLAAAESELEAELQAELDAELEAELASAEAQE